MIRPATPEDIKAFKKDRTHPTVRAYAVEYEGKLAAIAGYSVERDRLVAFSDMTEIDAPKMTIYRHAKEIMRIISEKRLPIMAIADPNKPNSGRFLESLGFTYVDDSPEGEIYTWHN